MMIPAPRNIGLRLRRLANLNSPLHGRPYIRTHPLQIQQCRSRFFSTKFKARELGTGTKRWSQSLMSVPRNIKSRILRQIVQMRSFATAPKPNPTPHLGSPAPSLSFSERLRKLSREYGWSALGVYLALSALDFPFCFLAVRMLGTDRIGHWEHVIVDSVKKVVMYPFQTAQQAEPQHSGHGGPKDVDAASGSAEWTWGVEEAEKANNSGATLATQLALAYAIHKSFIFLRVPLTAAVTPKVVKVLRGWGWDIGKRKSQTIKS